MEVIIIGVVALLAITGTTLLSNRVGVAAPLLLVVLGIIVSVLPAVPAIEIEPEWILSGLLPPLLYSASVSMPTMDFRREFVAIGGLSVVLVVISAVALGFFFAWAIPGLSLAWGIALGAIVSPTDAVATSIVKRLGVSPRVVTMLEGESLLNDATALVLLRTAIAAAAAAVSFWGVLGSFVYSVAIACVIGFVVGRLNLFVRARTADATVSTVISFTIPFLASIPAELLGASGLVAAVAAGLITGHGAARALPPRHRLSDEQNWQMISYVLEGAVFLMMGLELFALVEDVHTDFAGVLDAIGVAALGLLIVLVVRTGYVALLVRGGRRRNERGLRVKTRVEQVRDSLRSDSSGEDFAAIIGSRATALRGQPIPALRMERIRTRWRRAAADIDYFLAQPLGWREGSVIVWAGMRGAITVAAAQTLPTDTPNRSLLVFIAFVAAAVSLLVQGSTLSSVVRWLKPAMPDPEAASEERARVKAALRAAAASVVAEAPDAASSTDPGFRLRVIAAQRAMLLDARDDGLYSAQTLEDALAVLDAEQISTEMRKGALAGEAS